ncbi:hypothetical protein LY78DRAFT_66461 [Colletotrichum sublineola]|nr:hypothetical protein LY78DRAFT_66461 [Colletotrichum sublineola]
MVQLYGNMRRPKIPTLDVVFFVDAFLCFLSPAAVHLGHFALYRGYSRSHTLGHMSIGADANTTVNKPNGAILLTEVCDPGPKLVASTKSFEFRACLRLRRVRRVVLT